MAASMAKHAFAIPMRNFRYSMRCNGYHALQICGKVQIHHLYGCRYLSSCSRPHSHENRRVNDEATLDSSDSSKVDEWNKLKSYKSRNKFEVSRSRMREKYNLASTEASSSDNLYPSRKDSSETTASEDFFGVMQDLSESEKYTDTDQSPRKEQMRNFNKVAQRHPYLKNKPLRNTVKVYETSFGYMTLDNDLQKTKQKHPKQSATEDQGFIDQQYFGDIDQQYSGEIDQRNAEVKSEGLSEGSADVATGKNYIEDQYFASNTDVSDETAMPWQQMNLDKGISYDDNAAKFLRSDEIKPFASEKAESKTLPRTFTSRDSSSKTGKNYIEDQYFESNTDETAMPWQQMNLNKGISYDDDAAKFLRSDEIKPFASEKAESKTLPKTFTSRDSSSKTNTFSWGAEAKQDIFEEQYFGNFEVANRSDKKDDSVIFEEQYFGDNQATLRNDAKDDHLLSETPLLAGLQESKFQEQPIDHELHEGKLSNPEPIYIEKKTRWEEKAEAYRKPDFDNPKSAYDEAIKIRQEMKGKKPTESVERTNVEPKLQKWKGEVDSKGFRKLKSQVLNLQNLPEDVVVNILKDSILYETEDMLALYKPYGLPSHGGPGVHHSIGKLLSKLAQRIDKPQKDLHLVHRLDKETTGVMVIAKSEQVAWKLHMMFKKREVQKKYWVLTKGVPSPPEGIIQIPMGETEVGRYHRMTLRPNYNEDTKLYMTSGSKAKSQEAVTNYKVLGSSNSVALVECVPETGIKHQIRCHLAFGLNTPVLGDHKYSHVSKIAPQRLYPEILQKLGIRQATVRYVPMHLHAKALVFPELMNGRNVFISARLPKYFIQNMKWLGLNIPE